MVPHFPVLQIQRPPPPCDTAITETFTPGYVLSRAVFVRFSLGGQSFDWRLATIAGMEVAKLVPWNSLLNKITSVSIEA